MFSRMPGGFADVSAEDFDLGVVRGLRSAGAVLLLTAALETAVWLMGAATPFPIIVDALLGVQLTRLQHSWKLWALIRAWAGGALALLAIAAADTVSPTVGVPLAATAAYAAALILFLTGTPTAKAIWLGWAAFAASILLYGVFFVLLAASLAAHR